MKFCYFKDGKIAHVDSIGYGIIGRTYYSNIVISSDNILELGKRFSEIRLDKYVFHGLRPFRNYEGSKFYECSVDFTEMAV
jgi:hypothetical protein